MKIKDKLLKRIFPKGIFLRLPEGFSAENVCCIITKVRKVAKNIYKTEWVSDPVNVKVNQRVLPIEQPEVEWLNGEYKLCTYDAETRELLSTKFFTITWKKIKENLRK